MFQDGFSVKEMTDSINKNDLEILDATAVKLEYHKRLLWAANNAAQILLEAINEDTFEISVLESMKILANCLHADRGYIWQNKMIDGSLHYEMRFEWQNNIGQHTNPVPKKAVFPYSQIPTWEANFLKNECVNGGLDNLTIEEQAAQVDRVKRSEHGVITDPFFFRRAGDNVVYRFTVRTRTSSSKPTHNLLIRDFD